MSIDNGKSIQVNAVTDIDAAHRLARKIENAEAKRLGVSIPEARVTIARRLRTSLGTLENIRRRRIKVIPNWLMSRIKSEFVSVLQAEIAGLENEISIAKQIGIHHSDDALFTAEAQLAAARQILAGEVR